MRNKRFVLISIIIIVLLTACNSGQAPEEVMTPISITDSTGNTVEFEMLPERIVLAGRATNMLQDAVFLFPEALTRVLAVEDRRQSLFVFLPVVDPDIAEKAILEMNAGAEQIAALQPGLVILKNSMAEKLGAPLAELDIPVLYLDLETPDVFYYDIRVLGQVFGSTERAEEIVAFYQSRLQSIEEVSSTIAVEAKPNVLLLSYNDKGDAIAFEVPPASWLQTTLVELAGGTPIWTEASEAGGWTVVSFEQIAAWDADQIFVIDYQGRGSEIVEGLKIDPLWLELKAVQNDQLYAFAYDFYSWDQPDTRWILGAQWLATKIQPEAFSNLDILAEMQSFYETLYNLSLTQIEEEVLPLLTGDLP